MPQAWPADEKGGADAVGWISGVIGTPFCLGPGESGVFAAEKRHVLGDDVPQHRVKEVAAHGRTGDFRAVFIFFGVNDNGLALRNTALAPWRASLLTEADQQSGNDLTEKMRASE